MGESPQIPSSPSLADAAESLLCANCGYDLRQSPGELCSECGQPIDRTKLATSNFPWAHRRHRGRIRSFIKMVWHISIDSKHLRYESARKQLLSDARTFRKVMVALLATVPSCALLILAISHGGLHFLGVSRYNQAYSVPVLGITKWYHDLAVPWSAATAMLPTWPLLFIFLAIYLTGIQQRLIRIKNAAPATQESAHAISFYALAPLAWLLPLFLVWAPFFYLVEKRELYATWLTILLAAISWNALVILLLTMLRIVQWNLRCTNRGGEYSMTVAPKLLGLWLLGLLVFLGILPWCIGFIWLIIDSFR